MNKRSLLVIILLVILAADLQAQLPIDGVHYPVGLEGIKGGSLPEPGIYFRDDNLFYTGTSDLLPDFHTFVYLQAPQLTWMTGWKIFGANYGMDVLMPFVYKQANYQNTIVSFGGHTITLSEGGNKSGLGDVKIEPLLLSWHLKHFDFTAGYALWVPTGDYNNSSVVNLGDGCWTHMMTLGGVWYPDAEKTWSVSVLNHYEFNSKLPGLQSISFGGLVTTIPENIPCSTYSLEWGVGKTICKETDVGIIGYYQEQFTDQGENGAAAFFGDSKVAGIGPEICTQISRWGLSASLRYNYEFLADNRPHGHNVDLTLTKRF